MTALLPQKLFLFIVFLLSLSKAQQNNEVAFLGIKGVRFDVDGNLLSPKANNNNALVPVPQRVDNDNDNKIIIDEDDDDYDEDDEEEDLPTATYTLAPSMSMITDVITFTITQGTTNLPPVPASVTQVIIAFSIPSVVLSSLSPAQQNNLRNSLINNLVRDTGIDRTLIAQVNLVQVSTRRRSAAVTAEVIIQDSSNTITNNDVNNIISDVNDSITGGNFDISAGPNLTFTPAPPTTTGVQIEIVLECQDGQYVSGDECLDCDNCSTCDNNGLCTSCPANFYGPNCLACPTCSNGVCSDSIIGDGACNCTVGFFGTLCDTSCQNDNTAMAGNCVNASSVDSCTGEDGTANITCSVCTANYYRDSTTLECKSCQNNVTAVVGNCLSATDVSSCISELSGVKCSTCNTSYYKNSIGDCLTCNDNYIYTLGGCSNANTNVISCNGTNGYQDSVICEECRSTSPVYYDSSTGTSPNTTFNCQPCRNNNTATVGACLDALSVNSCAGGEGTENITCSVCAANYYRDSATYECKSCQNNVTAALGNCLSATDVSSCDSEISGIKCSTCNTSYYKDSIGTCLTCNDNYIYTFGGCSSANTNVISCNGTNGYQDSVICEECRSTSPVYYDSSTGTSANSTFNCQPCQNNNTALAGNCTGAMNVNSCAGGDGTLNVTCS